MEIQPTLPTPLIRPATEARVRPAATPEVALPQDGSDLHHLFPAPAVPSEPLAPAATALEAPPAPLANPALDPGFAPGARQKLQAAIGGTGNSLLNAEHTWPGAWTAPPALANPAPFAGMLVNPHAGAAAMPQMPVPADPSPSLGSRLKAAAQKFWDFGMSGGLIGQARRNRQAATPPAVNTEHTVPPAWTKAAAAPPAWGAPAAAATPQAWAPPVAGGPQVRVQVGDITRMPAQALISNINSEGMWWGGIDGAIQGAAGNQFHTQAAQVLERSGLQEGQTVHARAQQPHKGAFGDVVFVVDDGRKPLREIVLEGLRAADRAGMQSVSLPAMRTGVMAGPAGPGAALREMAAGIQQFQGENPASVRDIQVVVYKDPTMARALQEELARA